MEVFEFLKIRGNKSKVAKAVGVSSAYISQGIKAGKFSAEVTAKIEAFVTSQHEPPAQG